MVFKRRERLSWLRRFSDFVYPRTGWRRAIEYIGHRIKRLPDTPHRIALGFACGVFVSFSPMFGFHFFYCALLAVLLRGNVLASIIGTFVGNPLTFPFIATASLTLGRRIMGMRAGDENFASVQDSFIDAMSGLWQSMKSIFGLAPPAWDKLGPFWTEIFVPYFIGGIAPGLIGALISYFLGRPLIAAYQHRRRSKLLARAKERLATRKAEKLADDAASGNGKRTKNVSTGHAAE